MAPTSAIRRRPSNGAGGVEDAAQLHEHALTGDDTQPLGVRACQRARGGVGLKVQLDGDPHEAQHPQGVLGERLRPGGAQAPAPKVLDAPQRIDRLAHAGARLTERLGDRVDGEVPQCEVLLQRRTAKPLEVDLPGAVAGEDAPASVLLGERERCGPTRRAGDCASGLPGLAVEHHVEVLGAPAENTVADGAAHQPRSPAGERCTDQFEGVIRRRQVAPPRRRCGVRGRLVR